jgi:hypothetical protein
MTVNDTEAGAEVRRSIIARNGVGIDIGSDAPGSTSLRDLQITDNWFVGNRGTGLVLDLALRTSGTPPPWPVSRNRFSGNGGDGAHITARDQVDGLVTVAGNDASWNGGQGIVAKGVIDGGKNRARGNAVAPQCVGVRCT